MDNSHQLSIVKIILPLVAMALILNSCSKDNNSPNQTAALPKTYTEELRSATIGNSLTTYNLTYDGSGRLVSMISTGSPVFKLVNQYSTNSFTADTYTNDVLQIHEMLWLNSSSFLDSTYQYNITGDTTTEKYVYNASHLLTQKNEYEYHQSGAIPSGVTNYTYDNMGNLTTEVNNPGTTTQYTYYTNLSNIVLFNNYLPQPKYMVQTATLNQGGFLTVATHYYTFDNNQRLIKDSIPTTGIDVTIIKSYTY